MFVCLFIQFYYVFISLFMINYYNIIINFLFKETVRVVHERKTSPMQKKA